MSKPLKRELSVMLPCGELLRAKRYTNFSRSDVWLIKNGYGVKVAEILATKQNAQALIDFITELSRNTPGGLR